MFKEILKRYIKPALNKGDALEVLFVHIPKTAGTSFRAALSKKLNLCLDYGINARETSECAKFYIYGKHDFYGFYKSIEQEGYHGTSGHYPLAKYIDLVPAFRSILFIRNPYQQVLSHFNHHANHLNYSDSLEVFLREHRNINFQFRQFSTIPIELIGLVGITEKYNESIVLASELLNVELESLEVNVNNNRVIQEFPDNLKCLFDDLNRSELILYDKAVSLFDQRILMRKKNLPWTYLYAKVNQNGLLTGCAYQSESQEPIKIDLYIDGVVVSHKLCNSFFGLFPKMNFPRKRYVGFSYIIENYSMDLDIEVKVCSSGQIYKVRPQVI